MRHDSAASSGAGRGRSALRPDNFLNLARVVALASAARINDEKSGAFLGVVGLMADPNGGRVCLIHCGRWSPATLTECLRVRRMQVP